MKRIIPFSLCLLCLPGAVFGKDRLQHDGLPDFEQAREAMARGEILPLADVLARVEAVHPGQVIEVELEYEDGQRIYEIELITPQGALIEIYVDAMRGSIIEVEAEDE